MARTSTNDSSTETAARPGRKAVADKEAPHGRDEQGNPLAPFGFLENGNPRATRKLDMTGLTADFLAQPFAVEPVEAQAAAPVRARSDEQKAMDVVAEAVHAAWKSAGGPSQWLKMPKAKYPVPPEMAEGLRAMIRRSAEFLGYRAKLGSPSNCDPRTCGICANLPEDQRGGHELVIFSILDKRGTDKPSE